MIIAVIMGCGRRVCYVAVFVSWCRIRAYRLRTTIAYVPVTYNDRVRTVATDEASYIDDTWEDV